MTAQTLDALKAEIETEIKTTPIMIYTKGTKEEPRCGYTRALCQFFDQFNKPYVTQDVLEQPEKRQLLNELFDWPTLPKVFINGEFYGDNDTLDEMMANGELQPIIDAAFAQ
jgi:monothiol glutaredoxin